MARAGIFSTHQIYSLHVRVDRQLRAAVTEDLKAHRLTLMEWLLLMELVAAGSRGVGVSAVAGGLGVSLPQVTALVSGLQKKRLVRQKTGSADKRARQIFITQRGEDTAYETEQLLNKTFKKVFANVQPGELAEYQKVQRLVG